MNESLWADVDRYVEDVLIARDEVLDSVLRASDEAGLPSHHVSPTQGKLLHLLARACGAKRILEIGTLAGYSTIWLARALQAGGRLVTLEANPHHADVARQNLALAGLSDVVEVRTGPALETLPGLEERWAPFDFVFIDADKASSAEYFLWALKLSRVGSVIITDNVVREGALVDASSGDASVRGARRLHDAIASESRVSATTIQTVGRKGHDGFTLAVVLRA
jgi:predicted O-methyltransferase YrrM